MNVVSYARVVPGEGAQLALQHQRDRLDQYCVANSLILTKHFCEEISGDISCRERPKLSEAIDGCAAGDTLLVVRLDRLSSQKRLVAEIFEYCQGKSIKVAAVAGPQTPDNMQNSLEVTVQAG